MPSKASCLTKNKLPKDSTFTCKLNVGIFYIPTKQVSKSKFANKYNGVRGQTGQEENLQNLHLNAKCDW